MAGIAGVTHHIELDGKGYMIAETTYRQANQAPLIQRVAMGGVDLTSVSNFQYVRQDDFSGGENLKTFGDPDSDRYWDSYGFYPKGIEELRLLRAVEKSYSAAINDCFLIAFGGKLWLADKTQASLKYSTDGVSFSTFTPPTGYSGAIGGMAVVHNRDMDERLLVMSATGIFFGIKPDGTVDTDVGDANGVKDYSGEFGGGTWSHVIEWGHSIYMGHDQAVFRRSAMEGTEQVLIFSVPGVYYRWALMKYLESAYGALMGRTGLFVTPTDFMDLFPAGQGAVTCMAHAQNPQILCVGTYDSGIQKSFITISSGTAEFPTDKGDAVNFAPALELPDFEIRSMIGYQGQLIYGGKKLIGGRSVGQVYIYPRRLVAEVGEDLTDAFDYTVRAMAVHEDVLFGLSNNVQSDGKHAPGLVALNYKGFSRGPQPTSFTSASSTRIDAIETFKDQTYWAVRGVGLYRTSTARTFVTAARLESSRFDGNMKVVDKKWLELTLRLGAALTSDQQIVLKYQVAGGSWTTLFTMTSADGIEKVASFDADVISTWVKLALEFTQSSADSDIEVESLVLRHLVVGDTKLEWAFEILAFDNIELLDATETSPSMATRDGLEIMQDLRSVYLARQPVTFEDIDGTEYTVMITNIMPAAPEIEHPGTDDLEFAIAAEFMEV